MDRSQVQIRTDQFTRLITEIPWNQRTPALYQYWSPFVESLIGIERDLILTMSACQSRIAVACLRCQPGATMLAYHHTLRFSPSRRLGMLGSAALASSASRPSAHPWQGGKWPAWHWVEARIQKAPARGAFCILEPLIGIEPMTSSLPFINYWCEFIIEVLDITAFAGVMLILMTVIYL